MRFLMTNMGGGKEPDEQLFADMAAFVEELTKEGVLLATGGLGPASRLSSGDDGRITVTDGPFAEAKESVVGFALIDVRSRAEALELSERFVRIVGGGVTYMSEVFGPE
ncbi:YciI family protein [Actinocorallia longicatena]|uniref:YCII-related domain-containing protein n=1 Tax=Actinocorallia longicatena TaxID=111803 RepID=A0ABP6QB22_9ACTN